MWFILALSNYSLLAYNAVTLGTFILRDILTLMLAVLQYNSPVLLLIENLRYRISFKVFLLCLRGRKSSGLIHSSISVIFRLQGGQEVGPFFLGQLAIVLIFILHIILHVLLEAKLSCNVNLIIRELFFTGSPIFHIILIPLLRSWSQKLSNIMHLINALSIMENT